MYYLRICKHESICQVTVKWILKSDPMDCFFCLSASKDKVSDTLRCYRRESMRKPRVPHWRERKKPRLPKRREIGETKNAMAWWKNPKEAKIEMNGKSQVNKERSGAFSKGTLAKIYRREIKAPRRVVRENKLAEERGKWRNQYWIVRVTIKLFCPRCTHYYCCNILSSPNNPTLNVQYIGVNMSKKNSLLNLNQITTYQLAQNGFIKKKSSRL